MAGRNFIGRGWSHKFNNGGMVINISIPLDKLMGLPTDSHGNVRMVVGQRRELDEKSKADYWVAEDTYQKAGE